MRAFICVGLGCDVYPKGVLRSYRIAARRKSTKHLSARPGRVNWQLSLIKKILGEAAVLWHATTPIVILLVPGIPSGTAKKGL
jgi:hypothetical protein